MEIPVNEIIHVLTFNAPGHEDKQLTVTSPYIAMIHKFISVHLTPEAEECIKTYHVDDLPAPICDYLDDTNLIYYKLRSNNKEGEFLIPTSRQIFEQAATGVCNSLSNICIFGDVITCTDLPIMDVLTKLISTLEFVCIMDNQIINEDLSPGYNNPWEKLMDDEYDCVDKSYVYGAMLKRILNSKPDEMPVTVEGYVSAFTQFLYDPRKW